jgi:two-component system sensor histidine kinase BarA
MSLPLKIILVVGLALGALMALFGSILVDDEEQLLRELLSRRGTALAQVIADFSIETLVVEDYPVLETALNTVGNQTEDILSISVLQRGRPVAQFQRDADMAGTRTVRDILLPGLGGMAPKHLGRVELVLSDQANRDFIGQRRHKMWLFIGITFVVLATTLGLILQRLVLGRVERLTRFAERVTSQQSGRIGGGGLPERGLQEEKPRSRSRGDEIGRLAWSLSVLEQTVEEKDAQLHRYTTDLERTVEERTAELQWAKDRAESSDRAKSLFLANMSHEIRTPINGVLGFTRLLAQSGLDGRQREYVQTITASAESLRVIIDDILSYSKLEAGRMEIVEGPYDLQLLVDSTVRLFTPEAYRKGLELTHGIAFGTPTRLVGDPVRIRQVLTNLLGNAVKFTHEGSVCLWIEQVDAESGSRLRFQVSDTGIGLDSTDVEQLFSPFTQGDPSVTRRFGGAGLGLAICKQLVERMQGSIGVTRRLAPEQGRASSRKDGVGRAPGDRPLSESRPGSLFWFDLPLKAQEGSPLEEDQRPALTGRLAWLYEPHAQAGRSIRHNLLRMGLQVDSLPSLESLGSLIDSARSTPPELLVLGLGNGRQNAELANVLPKLPPIPTLALCNWPNPRPGDCGVAAGQAVAKACSFHQLAPEIERLIDPAADRAEPQPSRAEPPPGLKGLRVLVVDDNPINLKLTETIISAAGLEAIPAASGEDAVRLAKSERPSLILMDIQMPGMSGLEAARLIRREEKDGHIPIIAVTAHAFPEEQQGFLAQGIDDCVSKPLYPDQLWSLIAHWVGAHRTAPRSGPRQPAKTLYPLQGEARPQLTYDRSRAIELAGGEAQAQRMWERLIQRLPQDLKDLDQARSTGDPERLRRLAHSLHGNAIHCVTPDLLASASALDQAVAEGEGGLERRAEDLERSIRALLALG